MPITGRRVFALLAALAACTALALTVTTLVATADASAAEAAQKKRTKKRTFKLRTDCFVHYEDHPPAGTGRNFADLEITAKTVKRTKSGRRVRVPVRGVRVSAVFADLTPVFGDNALTKIDRARTNRSGLAALLFELDYYGIFEIKYTVAKRGYKTRQGSIIFLVSNRITGPCRRFR